MSNMKELNSAERKLLIRVINGTFQDQEHPDLVNLSTKLQNMDKADYQATRSTRFWADISRSWKNSKEERMSSSLALSTLGIFYKGELAKAEAAKELNEICDKLKAINPKASKAKIELDECVKKFAELDKIARTFTYAESKIFYEIAESKYMEVYNKRTAEERMIDAYQYHSKKSDGSRMREKRAFPLD